MNAALSSLGSWPGAAAAGFIGLGDGEGSAGIPLDATVEGPADRVFRWASITKVLTALCIWVAVEEGTVAWDDPAGPPGSTLADLLSHASGLSSNSDAVMTQPRRRRIYSNSGIESAARHLERRAGISFFEYLSEGVLGPLQLDATRLDGSPAHGARGPLTDLLKLARELLEPTLVSHGTLALATSVACPGLAGVLPGFGRQAPNDWGLGVEIRDSKSPHWTGRNNSPSTFGHFGQAGGFVWVDPDRGLALAALGEAPFGPWAANAWPLLSDSVIASSPGYLSSPGGQRSP